MIEDSSWSDKHGCLYVKDNGRWRPALLGEYFNDYKRPEIPLPQWHSDPAATDADLQHWRTIAVIAILVAMVLAFMLVLS